MGSFKVFVKPFDRSGAYQDDFIEVTKDVTKISNIKQDLDQSVYDVGVYRFSTVKLTLRNDHGLYLDQTEPRSIFEFKRQNSIVRFEWNFRNEPMTVGFFKAGDSGPPSRDVIFFEGLLSEVSATSSIDEQTVSFDILGYESIFDTLVVPFGDLSNGDTFSEVLFSSLNQPEITSLITVSESNINPGIDIAIDDISDLENITVKELLSQKQLLLLSASVLTVEDGTLYVKSREETADVKLSFYGQASTLGRENMLDVRKFRYGLSNTFNFWTWTDTSLSAEAITSREKFGTKKRELNSKLITVNSKREDILEKNRDDFGDPKVELEVLAPLDYDTIALKLLDKVDIDYPTVFVPSGDNDLPLIGQAVWGSFEWPDGKWSLTLTQNKKFKVVAKRVQPTNETMLITLRET